MHYSLHIVISDVLTPKLSSFLKFICLLFAEKLTEVRGDLVAVMRVGERFLSYMMQKSTINMTQKSSILRVCTVHGWKNLAFLKIF